ncbi:hypothetical protein PI125_g27092 [Phytophthora idaei]|nr:hypothetical protein PI125_g27092 [Phytophthora idaei]
MDIGLATFRSGEAHDKQKIHTAIAMFVMSTTISNSKKARTEDTYPHIQ